VKNKKIISTTNAPAAIGPYSQGVIANNFIFISGQISIDMATGKITGGSIKEQTERVLKNIKAILEAADSSLNNVVKCTVYLKDINTFSEMNEKYKEFFKENPPARATVEVANLPKDAGVEIDAIAILK